MRRIILFVIILYVGLYSTLSYGKDCILDKRAYGSWQQSQQWSDYNKSNFYKDRADSYHEQGRSDLEHNERAWQRLYDNGRERSRLYHEFNGPYNKYNSSGND